MSAPNGRQPVADFSCIPCNGQLCFPRPIAERRACSKERHPCPVRVDSEVWACRCCSVCTPACRDEETDGT